MNPDTETLGLDSAQSGLIWGLLAVLFIGLLSLSETKRLRGVDRYKLVSVIFKEYSSQIRTNQRINLNQYQLSKVSSSQ